MTVRKAVKDDYPAIASILGEAIGGLESIRWLAGDIPDFRRRWERMMHFELMKASRQTLIFTTDDLAGAAIWQRFDKGANLWDDLHWTVNLFRCFGLRLRLMGRLGTLSAFAKYLPKTTYYYLDVLAVREDRRSGGFGSALVQVGLAECDREKTDAFLITDSKDNVRFYNRFRFQVAGEIILPETAVHIYAMIRKNAGF